MACSLATPLWVLPGQTGLQAAQDNPAQSAITLTWGTAVAVAPGEDVFYNIYWGTDITSLFDAPKAFSTASSVNIPKTSVSDGYFFAVKASQLGVVANFDNVGGAEQLDTLTYLYPSSVATTAVVDTTGAVASVPVDGYAGFPDADGYIQLGSDILLYSSINTATSSFVITSSDPFGCNDGYAHPVGTSMSLFKGFEEGNTAAFPPFDACFLAEPTWEVLSTSLEGLEAAADVGLGTVVRLTWPYASSPDDNASDIYYNIYWNTSRRDLFDAPQGISQSNTALVPDLSPGTTYYFAVRASYFAGDWDITDLEQLSDNLYAYPEDTIVDEPDGYYFENELAPLEVNSTSGFPDAGFLILGTEVVEYNSKTSISFNIIDRDVFDLGQSEDHANGVAVKLYAGVEDSNQRVFRGVPSWDARRNTPQMEIPEDGYAYLQDEDGYRSFPEDILTEDHSNYQDENEDFTPQPFCGYRSQNFVDLYTRNTCGTYFGGQFTDPSGDGTGLVPGPIGGGINLNEVNLQREEFLLGLTGEPFVLLQRKWTGKVCACISHRHEHPQARCPNCFGTGFEGGFDRYEHDRQIRPGVANPNGLIMLRVEPYNNDLDLSAERGLTQIDQLRVWGTAIPPMKDRDILIRYISANDFSIVEEEFRYEILFVNRNKTLFGLDGRQQATIKKLDQTDPAMHFPVSLI